MTNYETYESPFCTRYASEEMQFTFSAQKKFSTFRSCLLYTSCPSYKTNYSRENVIRLPGFVKSVNGERHADGITLSDGSIIAVDGVFFLKQTVSADVLLDGLEMNNGSVAVNRDMSTSVKAVSYTHLDVYKRQTLYQTVKPSGTGFFCA